MSIDTKVFIRILTDHREAGVEATRKAMEQTTRFGCLPNKDHVAACARDAYEAELKSRAAQSVNFPA